MHQYDYEKYIYIYENILDVLPTFQKTFFNSQNQSLWHCSHVRNKPFHFWLRQMQEFSNRRAYF